MEHLITETDKQTNKQTIINDYKKNGMSCQLECPFYMLNGACKFQVKYNSS